MLARYATRQTIAMSHLLGLPYWWDISRDVSG